MSKEAYVNFMLKRKKYKLIQTFVNVIENNSVTH